MARLTGSPVGKLKSPSHWLAESGRGRLASIRKHIVRIEELRITSIHKSGKGYSPLLTRSQQIYMMTSLISKHDDVPRKIDADVPPDGSNPQVF
tara:strand:+ start:411 stop:692 length:282 start_codon:yes stop_codon:yes gene_type:complete